MTDEEYIAFQRLLSRVIDPLHLRRQYAPVAAQLPAPSAPTSKVCRRRCNNSAITCRSCSSERRRTRRRRHSLPRQLSMHRRLRQPCSSVLHRRPDGQEQNYSHKWRSCDRRIVTLRSQSRSYHPSSMKGRKHHEQFRENHPGNRLVNRQPARARLAIQPVEICVNGLRIRRHIRESSSRSACPAGSSRRRPAHSGACVRCSTRSMSATNLNYKEHTTI